MINSTDEQELKKTAKKNLAEKIDADCKFSTPLPLNTAQAMIDIFSDYYETYKTYTVPYSEFIDKYFKKEEKAHSFSYHKTEINKMVKASIDKMKEANYIRYTDCTMGLAVVPKKDFRKSLKELL